MWFAQAGIASYQYTHRRFLNAPYAGAFASLSRDGRASLPITASHDSEDPGLPGGDARACHTRGSGPGGRMGSRRLGDRRIGSDAVVRGLVPAAHGGPAWALSA